LKKLIILAIVFASISGIGFLGHNVFSIDLQTFQLIGSIAEFDSPVCTCAGADGLFSMENCQQFMGDYSDPNMLCVWEAGIEEYGDPPSSAQGCDVAFWKNNAGTFDSNIIESDSDTDWPPGYQPDYYYNDMFHTTILTQSENEPSKEKHEKKDSKENEVHDRDVILEDEENETTEDDDKKKDSKENEVHDRDIIREDEDEHEKKDSKENEVHDRNVIREDEENETSEDWEDKRKEKREKILICHNNNTIEVNSAALRDHKKHGDSMGACQDDGLGPTLLEALNAKGGEMNALLRQSVAALLNAAHSDVNYPNTVVDVISSTQIALISEDYDETANMFEEFNEDSEKPLFCRTG